MKEIKFRLYKNERYYFFSLQMLRIVANTSTTLDDISYKDLENAQQYTGLKDTNGKEIYEGDIVKDLTPYADLWEIPGLFENNKVILNLLVKWVDSEARFQLYGDFHPVEWYYQYTDQMHDRRLEVIGNVFENSDLLKPKESII